jgi:hypothetical protein
MAQLVQRFRYAWAMTGTPTPREPTDAYGLLKLVTPSAFPGSFTRFRDQMMVKVSNFKYVPRRGAQEKVFTLMQPAVRFTMADCTDMPPVTYTDHEVQLSPKQKHVYETMRKHCRMLWQTTQVTAVNGGVLLNKLLQISSGCVYDDKHGVEPSHQGWLHRAYCLGCHTQVRSRQYLPPLPELPHRERGTRGDRSTPQDDGAWADAYRVQHGSLVCTHQRPRDL